MTVRIQITKPTYMKLNGQDQIVLPGSVVDVAAAGNWSTENTKVLNEAAGALRNNQPTGVRNCTSR